MGDGDHPANWYADPWTPRRLRYWDGNAWTPHVHDPVVQFPAATTQPSLAHVGDPVGTERIDQSPTWRDLAENRPGQIVRAKAEELRQAAPFRTFVARVFRVNTDERAFRVGADGEDLVARRLRKLNATQWHIIHSVPVADEVDIDHVVIGPAGVFTLNTKHHPNGSVWVGGSVVMVNGQREPYVGRARAEGRRAASLLSAACGFPVSVQPVVVVIAARFQVKEQPRDVWVVARNRIRHWLAGQPATLAPEVVAAIYEQARRDSTWFLG